MSDNQNEEENEVLELKDARTVSDSIHQYPSDIKRVHVPLVIDNGKKKFEGYVLVQTIQQFGNYHSYEFLCLGSFNCRVGWATQIKPSLIFKNLVAKTRKERGKKVSIKQVLNRLTCWLELLDINLGCSLIIFRMENCRLAMT